MKKHMTRTRLKDLNGLNWATLTGEINGHLTLLKQFYVTQKKDRSDPKAIKVRGPAHLTKTPRLECVRLCSFPSFVFGV